MVVLIFSFFFLAVILVTQSYKYFSRYYSTIHFVACLSLFYTLICRGHLLWQYSTWWLISPKLCNIIQFAVLFPCTTVVYLRFLPHGRWHKTLYLLGFVGLYAVMEWFMFLRGEITYHYGWNFLWSLFIDSVMFILIPVHERSWKIALVISIFIIVFLIVWFHVPMTG